MKTISISTGSRLHWGLLASENDAGRSFGGVGVMIDSPGVKISLSKTQQDCAIGSEDDSQRVMSYLKRYRENSPVEFQTPACKIRVHNLIPGHCGLGSGTQLAIAIAHGLAMMADDPLASHAETLAKRMGRGLRSAIGLHGFFTGGLIVDAGKRDLADLSETTRITFSSTWRFLLVSPRNETGLSGTGEKKAFASFKYPAGTTEALSALLTERILPAVREVDFDQCCSAIFDYGQTVGRVFAHLQGDIFSSPLMQELSNDLRQKGILGHGQTSWGPTLFVLLPNETEACKLKAELDKNSLYSSCLFQIAKPLNKGATVIHSHNQTES